MNTKRNLLITGIIVIFFGIAGTGFYFFKKSLPEQNNSPGQNNQTWPPKISINTEDWGAAIDYSGVKEKIISNTLGPKIIKTANAYISNKIGEEFFNKYVKLVNYHPDFDAGIWLDYVVMIPEKNISFKTTSSPVLIRLYLKKDLSLEKPEQIASLPDCRDINRCLSFADRQKAIEAVISDIEKSGYEKVAYGISIRWMFSLAEHSMLWDLQYNLPGELPNCKNSFGGNIVQLYYNAFNDQIIEREEDCYVPGI